MTAALLLAAACTRVPELEERVSGSLQSADYPALLPLDIAAPQLETPEEEAQRIQDQLDGRREGLQSRARQLNAPVLDGPSRKRMQDGVQS